MDKGKGYINGPRWIRAKYSSRCSCGRNIAPGHRIFYHPSGDPGKRVACEKCGRRYKTTFIQDAIKAICKAY